MPLAVPLSFPQLISPFSSVFSPAIFDLAFSLGATKMYAEDLYRRGSNGPQELDEFHLESSSAKRADSLALLHIYLSEKSDLQAPATATRRHWFDGCIDRNCHMTESHSGSDNGPIPVQK